MLLLVSLFVVTLFLAYVNGANDNFKGVATLFGSRTIGYKVAIAWATLATCLGSVVSVFLATTLVKNFSGKGLLPDAIAAADDFHLAVALGAGVTVLLATLTGFPISTTHGLTGALLGAGLVAMTSGRSETIGLKVNFAALGMTFVLPLLLSPVLAAIATSVLYLIAHQARQQFGITTESCVCVGETVQPAFASAIPIATVPAITTLPAITIDQTQNCQQRYVGRFLGVSVQQLVDGGHFVSAGIVSFARGLNDTPKIVGLMMGLKALSLQGSAIAVGMAIAIGGLLNSRRVAETMSQKITTMNAGQGFSANLITGILVILASRFGLPVSTTHVSVGSIYGVGVISKQANNQVFSQILLSWVLTLPIAATISAIVYKCLHWAG
jgi:inorganic phosphate transporter, PiT family